MRRTAWILTLALATACGGDGADAPPADGAPATPSISGAGGDGSTVIALWEAGQPAFGIFVPSERERGATDAEGNRLPPLYTVEGARALGENPMFDYLFLNLEGSYDPQAVTALVQGIDMGTTDHKPTLLVRIPTIEDAGEEATRQRVAEVLAAGADGVVIPHVRTPDEARLAVSFFQEAGADVWSPENPDGTIVAMLMVEDVGAIEAVEEIVSVPGYSMLSCGIGSLTGAMGGDREGAETSCARVAQLAGERGMPSMMTAGAADLEARMQRYQGLLLSGSVEQAVEVIRTGRQLAGRDGM